LDFLLLAKFVYNNAFSTTTGVSPFFTNRGYYPNITIYLEKNITSFHVCKFAIDLDKLQDTLKIEISAIQ